MELLDILKIATAVLALAVAIIGHEIMHGWVAYLYGDNTAKNAGRLTINPISHVDLVGTIIVPATMYFLPMLLGGDSGFLFGWAKPVPINTATVIGRGGYNAAMQVDLAGIVYNFTLAAFASIFLVAMTAPHLPITHAKKLVESKAIFPGWPVEVIGQSLSKEPLKDRDRRFAEGFPGKIARFTDGHRQYIVRWITRPTRKLHPAADCFRAMGYQIKFNPLWIDPTDNRWASFDAISSNQSLTVRERIYDSKDNTWPDVSSWYWASVFNKESGPWFAVTMVEQRQQ